MLRGNFKTKLIYGGTLLAAFSLTIGSAWAGEIGPDTAAGAQKLKGAQLQCNPMDPAYQRQTPMGPQPDQAKLSACQSCKQAVDQQKQKIEQARAKAINENNAVVGAGSATTSAIGGATTGQQQNTQNNASGVNNTGNTAQAQRSALAKLLGQEAATCSSQVKSSCSAPLAQADKKAAEDAASGCQEVADKANANSAEKAASSGTMGDLSQLAGALGQALGPLAQMMAGQQQPTDPGYTDPYASGVATDTVAGSSLGTTTNPLAGTNIGSSANPNGTEFKAAKNNITGFTPSAASNFGPGAYDSGSAGSSYGDSASGGGTGMGSGAYSGGGGTGLSSSGASMSPGSSDAEKAAANAAAAAAGENYEVMAGGGGGSRPSFLGLKSRTEEDLGASGESVLGDLGLGEEGSRDLASNDELGAGIGEAEGETLFRVIHTKISEIKKRGSI